MISCLGASKYVHETDSGLSKNKALQGDILVYIFSYIGEEITKNKHNLVCKEFYNAHIVIKFLDYHEKGLLSQYIRKDLWNTPPIPLEVMIACVKIVTRELQPSNENLNKIFLRIQEALTWEALTLPAKNDARAITESSLSIQEKAYQIRAFLKSHQIACSQIIELYAGDNDLTSIPPEIGALRNLQVLHLWGNRISVIPPEIGALTTLRVLNLYGNQISVIPTKIGALTNLRVLSLSSNLISVIPPEIGSLTSLKKLDLSWNLISVIPSEIGSLTNLRVLYLQGNQLSRDNQVLIRQYLPACNLIALFSQNIPGNYALFLLSRIINS